MLTLQVLCLLSGGIGGAVAASPPPLDEAANMDRALDAAVEAVPTVKVTLDGGDRSMAELTATPAALFSPEWEAEYKEGDPGCDLARGSFMWRGQGFGSNVNSEWKRDGNNKSGQKLQIRVRTTNISSTRSGQHHETKARVPDLESAAP